MEAAPWLLRASRGSCGPSPGLCPGKSGFLSWRWRLTQCNSPGQ